MSEGRVTKEGLTRRDLLAGPVKGAAIAGSIAALGGGVLLSSTTAASAAASNEIAPGEQQACNQKGESRQH